MSATQSPMKDAFAARGLALRVLSGRRQGRAALDRAEFRGAAGPTRAVLQELVLGVRRHQFLLDAILARHVPDKLSSVEPHLREILRLGVHDLLFRERLPRPLVVDESVELCGPQKRARGFINAVLRRIADSLEPVELALHEIPLDRVTVEVSPRRALRLPEPFLPDFAVNPAQHLARRFTLTEWFCAELLRLLPLEAAAAARACCERQPVALRPVYGRCDVNSLMQRLQADGCTGVRMMGPVVELAPQGPVEDIAAFQDGSCVVQDATAAEVAPLLAPQPGERVLDLCAAPGGKTIHMAELMGGKGQIMACHRAGPAAAMLLQNIKRGAWECITPKDLGMNAARVPAGPYDAVLVDAPCSNSGVLAKRVEARFRLEAVVVTRLAEMQLQLLRSVAALVRPGGRLVYSTCSILPQENDAVVQAFLAAEAGFKLDAELLRYPQRTGRDGGYAARLLKLV